MRDSVAREKLATLEERLKSLSESLDKVDVDNYDFRDYKRQFIELVKELGWSFGEDGVLNREATINSSLGRLQAQITALVDAIGHKETYVDGKLKYEKVR